MDENELLSKYQKKDLIGEGVYGKVFTGSNSITNQMVAIKEIKNNLDLEGIPSTSLREIGILKRIKNNNIVK